MSDDAKKMIFDVNIVRSDAYGSMSRATGQSACCG